MALTPNQKIAVETTGRPLFIQAGAGTGKTFTLTNRLAYGLSDESGKQIPSVDNLLTITFTNKAAGELLGRVRAELRRRGLVEEALRVDAAWISTIHSMCRHILQAHAFEVGIDPGAQLLTEEETSDLRGVALEEMLKREAGSERLPLLLDSYGVDEVVSLIGQLVMKLELAPYGMASYDLGPAPAPATVAPLANLLASLTGMKAELEELGVEDASAAVQKNHRALSEVVDKLGIFLSGDIENLSWADISAFLESLPEVKGGNTAKAYKLVFKACREELGKIRIEAASASAYEELRAALELAWDVCGAHMELKRKQGAVDTDDLLIETYRLLEARPDVAEEYRARFATVMIDEFQDTDLLQVEIVRKFCDENLSTLTTVGDAQQSIYGFRGADLEVYRDVRAKMAKAGSREVELATNFRSHPGILQFVETIFSKGTFFGGDFLKVGAGEGNVRSLSWIDGAAPRVELLISAGEKSPEGRSATSVADLRKSDAVMVADEFERFKAAGADYGDMAILLSSIKSTKSGAYVNELRKRGIPCVISGGSEFYTQPEVKVLVMLLRFLEDQDDDEALFGLLGSHMFDIADDDLLELSVINKQKMGIAPDEARTKVSLWDALGYRVFYGGESVGVPLLRAYEILRTAKRASASEPLSTVLLEVVKRSGWYAHMQQLGVEGAAQYANVQRMGDLLDDFERANGRSAVRAAEHFREMCELAADGAGARGKPGAMVSDGNSAVQIMTIHASKGLEFPIVAVAEYERSSRGASGPSPQALTEDGVSYLSMQPKASGDVAAHFRDGEADVSSFADASDQDEFHVHAKQLSEQRAREEEQRLFYVALTRAREVLLLVAHDSRLGSAGKFKDGLTHDVMETIFPDALPSDGAVVKTDTGALVSVQLANVPYGAGAEDDESADAGAESGVHYLPRYGADEEVRSQRERTRVIESYSSLAHPKQENSFAPARLRNRAEDAETVSEVGSAFHAVAQWIAESSCTGASPALSSRIDASVRRYRLDEEGVRRLKGAVDAWLGSKRFAEAREFARMKSELPFCVEVRDLLLEGFIDLICIDGMSEKALVIDYKTGTSGAGEELRERYLLQAQCYAYAVLSSGMCSQVELAFVRPEMCMEEVTFQYSRDDLDELASALLRNRA